MSDSGIYLPSDIAEKLSISSILITVGNTEEIAFFDKMNFIASSVMFRPFLPA